MSEANLKVVEAIIEGFATRTPPKDLIAEDLEYVNPRYAVEAGVRREREALNGVFDVYPDFRFEPERHVDVGDDIVLIGIARGTSSSGLKGEWRQAHVWTIKDGVAVRFRWFGDAAEALDATLAARFRTAMEAYSRGDFDTALATFHPEIEWSVDSSVQPDAETYHGHEGVLRFWRTWGEALNELSLVIEECRALDDRVVLAITRAHGTGAGSGVEIESTSFGQIAEFEEGLVVRVRLFGDERRTRAAAGID